MRVELPQANGTLAPFELQPSAASAGPLTPFNRLVFAAAHVVANPPGRGGGEELAESVDWEATLRFREHLWAHGFGVAEAMDTAQRETLGWERSAELLGRTLRAAAQVPGRMVIGGAATDHLNAASPTLTQIIDAYVLQAEFIHARGGRVILFPTSLLPRHHPESKDYVAVYRAVCEQVSQPVFVHWLGDMFAPDLRDYFPGDSFWQIMGNNSKILGVKLSLLDHAREEVLRRRLAGHGQVVLTGDDFSFPGLILGGPGVLASGRFVFEGQEYPFGDFSHALLGILDGIAPVARRAFMQLAQGDLEGYESLMAPTVPLSRHIFGAPTRFYKAGLVFLAYLNGHQEHPHLLGGLERQRDIVHYAELFRLANAAGVIADPPMAYARMVPLLKSAGY